MEEYSIYNVDFGTGKGHEQGYPRPAIMLKIINDLGMCIVIPLTSNIDHLNLPYTVQINKTGHTNLKENSVALVFQVRAVDRMRITGIQIGRVEEYQVNKIRTVIKEMLTIN